MGSITSWNRLDPVSRYDDLNVGLQARIHDPLWMLARQWQTREFQATDAGSPVWAYFTAEQRPLTSYTPGQQTSTSPISVRTNGHPLPLEIMVEHEPVRRPENLRLAAEAGLHFLRLLRTRAVDKYRGNYLTDYPLVKPNTVEPLDAASNRFIGLMAGRVPDGNKLHAAWAARALGSESFVAAGDRVAVGQAVAEWVAWYDSLFSEPAAAGSTAWAPEHLEYSLRVTAEAAGGATVLTAPEFASGRLDWYAFDRQSDTAAGTSSTKTSEAIPTPVSFPGMPATRWWQFEDARIDYGEVKARPVDLARMLFVDLALTYGNDWFLMPVELPVGTVCRAPTLQVIDSFGERITISHYSVVDDGMGQWRLFSLASQDTVSDESLFFLPPVLGPILESAPVEDVLFLRDELTNLAWAVEKTVESPAGRALNRYEAYQDAERQQPPPTPPGPGKLTYLLGTSVPDFWVPLAPAGRLGSMSLNLLPMPRLDGTYAPIEPQGRLLEPDTSGKRPSFFNEEITRGGLQVTRTYQYARWINGETFLWVGRRKRTGRGEGSSGLRFDVVLPES